MKIINQRKIEKELQKALAMEYVKKYFEDNNLSMEKLKSQRFILSCNECAFAQPSEKKPNGLLDDMDTLPKTTLVIRLEKEQLKIEETEYTRLFLSK